MPVKRWNDRTRKMEEYDSPHDPRYVEEFGKRDKELELDVTYYTSSDGITYVSTRPKPYIASGSYPPYNHNNHYHYGHQTTWKPQPPPYEGIKVREDGLFKFRKTYMFLVHLYHTTWHADTRWVSEPYKKGNL